MVENLDFAQSQLIEEEEHKGGQTTDPTVDEKHPDNEILMT